MAAAAVRGGGGVSMMRSPRVPAASSTVEHTARDDELALPHTADDAAGFRRLSVAPNTLRRKREDDEYNDYGNHYHYPYVGGQPGVGPYHPVHDGGQYSGGQQRPFHFSHTPYARGPGYGVHSDHSGSEGNLSEGLEAYAVPHHHQQHHGGGSDGPPSAYGRFQQNNGGYGSSAADDRKMRAAPPVQPSFRTTGNHTMKSFHPLHFRHDEEDHQQQQQPPPPPYAMQRTVHPNINAPAATAPASVPLWANGGSAAAASTSSAERLRHEVEVLQASFQELQRQYGEKCGEVILLQKTVEALSKELSEVRRGGSGGGKLMPVLVDAAGSSHGGQGNAASVSARGGSVASSSRGAAGGAAAMPRRRHNVPNDGDATAPPSSFELDGSAANAASSLTTPSFYCDICNLAVNSDSTLRSHLQGERHRKALNRAATGSGTMRTSCADTATTSLAGTPKAQLSKPEVAPPTADGESGTTTEPMDVASSADGQLSSTTGVPRTATSAGEQQGGGVGADKPGAKGMLQVD